MRRFREFWPFYLAQHSKLGTRVLHLVGTTGALACVAVALATRWWWLLALAPVVGYSGAWIGHFFVEENRPATFGHPLWSFAADFRMYGLFLTGRLEAERKQTLGKIRQESGGG